MVNFIVNLDACHIEINKRVPGLVIPIYASYTDSSLALHLLWTSVLYVKISFYIYEVTISKLHSKLQTKRWFILVLLHNVLIEQDNLLLSVTWITCPSNVRALLRLLLLQLKDKRT